MTAAPLFPLGAVDFRGQKLGIIQAALSTLIRRAGGEI